MQSKPASAYNLQIFFYPIHGCRAIGFFEGLVENGFALEARHLRDPFDGRG